MKFKISCLLLKEKAGYVKNYVKGYLESKPEIIKDVILEDRKDPDFILVQIDGEASLQIFNELTRFLNKESALCLWGL